MTDIHHETDSISRGRRFSVSMLDGNYIPLPVETPGTAIASNVEAPEVLTSMGAGVATFSDCDFVWTHPCDETVYIIDGELSVSADDQTMVGRAGDILFMGKGAEVRYQADGTCHVFASLLMGEEAADV